MEKFTKQLEVPYNFDKSLISWMKTFDAKGERYHCIYTAPFWEDYISAKYFYSHESVGGLNVNVNNKRTREDYISHIENVQRNFPGKAMLLLQRNDELMNEKLLREFYIDKLHFSKFCVGSIEQAKVLKEINPEFEIVASITMKLEPEQINNNADIEKYFDCIVLWFPYNRDIEKVEKLPRKFKYILLVNCDCSIFCNGTHHWLAKTMEDEQNAICVRNFLEEENTFPYEITITPEDLHIWRNCVDYFKLQGREYDTKSLIFDIIRYSKDYSKYFNEEKYRDHYNSYKKLPDEKLNSIRKEIYKKFNEEKERREKEKAD